VDSRKIRRRCPNAEGRERKFQKNNDVAWFQKCTALGSTTSGPQSPRRICPQADSQDERRKMPPIGRVPGITMMSIRHKNRRCRWQRSLHVIVFARHPFWTSIHFGLPVYDGVIIEKGETLTLHISASWLDDGGSIWTKRRQSIFKAYAVDGRPLNRCPVSVKSTFPLKSGRLVNTWRWQSNVHSAESKTLNIAQAKSSLVQMQA